MPFPSDLPTSGSFFGPSTIRAMARMTMSSMGPTFGIPISFSVELTRLILRRSAPGPAGRVYHQTVESRFSISSTGRV